MAWTREPESHLPMGGTVTVVTVDRTSSDSQYPEELRTQAEAGTGGKMAAVKSTLKS